jgi:cytochrome c biogenesis protein CcmG/thiol:disulfide interchange protein DsbE
MEDTAVQAAPGARPRWLRLALILVPALVFLGLLTAAVFRNTPPPQVGDRAPAFEAELLSGKGVLALEDLKGKPAVINFWASWCVPCRDEAPMLSEAEARYGDEVTFVGIDIRDARSEAIEFAERYDLDYTHVRDEDLAIYDDFGLTGQPETFFLDERGVILEHVPGPLARETLFQLLDSLTARAG